MSLRLTFRPFLLALFALTLFLLTSCATTLPINPPAPTPLLAAATVRAAIANPCPVTEPVLTKPPKDSAIPDEPAFGYYYQNQDATILAGAWWTGKEADASAGEPGIKTGWFRPAGATMNITGQRLDGTAPPFHADIRCCYPTRFQATGLYFPTEGCWKVTAQAANSKLSFVVEVSP